MKCHNLSSYRISCRHLYRLPTSISYQCQKSTVAHSNRKYCCHTFWTGFLPHSPRITMTKTFDYNCKALPFIWMYVKRFHCANLLYWIARDIIFPCWLGTWAWEGANNLMLLSSIMQMIFMVLKLRLHLMIHTDSCSTIPYIWSVEASHWNSHFNKSTIERYKHS